MMMPKTVMKSRNSKDI